MEWHLKEERLPSMNLALTLKNGEARIGGEIDAEAGATNFHMFFKIFLLGMSLGTAISKNPLDITLAKFQ